MGEDRRPILICEYCGSIFLPGYRRTRFCSYMCRERSKNANWRKANPDKVFQKNRKYRETHRDELRKRYNRNYQLKRGSKVAYARRYRASNPSKFAKAKSESYYRNADQNRARARDYQRRHRSRYVIHRHNYFAKRRANGGTFTAAQWEDMKAHYSYRCLKCHRREPHIKLTLDHIIPVSRGGRHCEENIQPLCVSCNASKKQQIIDYRPITLLQET